MAKKDAKSIVNTVSPDNVFARRVNGFRDFDLDFIHVYPINVEIAITKKCGEPTSPACPRERPPR